MIYNKSKSSFNPIEMGHNYRIFALWNIKAASSTLSGIPTWGKVL